MKKKEGSVMKYLPILISLTAISILSLFYVSYLKNMDIKDQADLIAREYILKMETMGYLAGEDESKLVDALHDMGVIHINLNGTTRAEVSYGSPIALCIEGAVMTDDYQVMSLFDLKKENTYINLKITKSSTAKH